MLTQNKPGVAGNRASEGTPKALSAIGHERIVFIDKSNYMENSNFLSGIAFTRNEIIVGTEGLGSFLLRQKERFNVTDFEDGRFFAFVDVGDHVKMFSDPMGQDILFYYSQKMISVDGASTLQWMVSNSFLELVRKLRADRRALHLYLPPLAGHFIANGTALGAQLISNNTPISEIKVLPIGCEIRISKADASLSVVRHKSGLWLTQPDSGSYRDMIADYVQLTCARIKTLIDSDKFDIRCDLSGGHDSRAIFAMARLAGHDFHKRPALSNRRRTEDLKSARLVAAAFNLKLETSWDVEDGATDSDLYEMWKKGSLGVYLPISASGAALNTSKLRLHGGNFLSKEFGEHSPSYLLESLSRWYADTELLGMVKNEIRIGFSQIDVDIEHPFAMHNHYINFRGRIHYGRNWTAFSRAPLFTPLISQSLAKAAFKLSTHEYNRLKLSLDLLLALDNLLGVIPFDLPEKSFDMDTIAASPFWGRPLDVKADSLADHTLFAGATVRPQALVDGEHEPRRTGSWNSLRELLLKDFSKYETSAIAVGIFDDAYVARARAEIANGKSPSRDFRRVSHMVSAGILNELVCS
jgi:hypothetical protein